MRDYSNYHNINLNNKINSDSKFIFDRTLQGYASFDVLVNNEKESKILRYQRTDSNGSSYKIVGYAEDVERGNLITLNEETYLITNKPEDNRIYKKSIMELCQTSFPLVTEGEETMVGFDKLDRPIYEYTQPSIQYIPCVVEINNSLSRRVLVNEPVNLLDNQIRVTIPFIDHPKLNYNETFDLYRDNYRIIRINDTEQINGVGILRITGERVENRRD